MYENLTTKELKKKQSFRLVEGLETGSQGGEDLQKSDGWKTGAGHSWQSGQSHICVWINWEEQLGSETDHATQGSSMGK